MTPPAHSGDARQIRRTSLSFYDAMYTLDHFLGRRNVNAVFGGLRARMRERLHRNLRRRPGRVIEIDRVNDLSPEQFIERYLKRGRPVIFAGAARDWPCCANWDFDYLIREHGSAGAVVLPEARTTSGFRGTRDDESVRDTDFATLIPEMRAGGKSYIRFSSIVEDRAELAEQLDGDWIKRRFGPLTIGSRVYAFIGGAHSRTRLHCDMPPNLFVQVHGSKHWILYPPTYRAVIDPLLERSALSFTTNLEIRQPFVEDDSISHHLDRFEGVVEAGDILFNPAYMWHDVLNLTDTIGVSYRWLSPGIMLRASWVPQLLNLFSTNPPVWRAGLTKRDINANVLEAKIAAKQSDPDYVG